MALTTRIAAAQDGLKTLIDARVALATVKRILGDPLKALAKETIWISGDIEEGERVFELTGDDLAPEEETFFILCHAFVMLTGDNYKKARDRALVLAGEIELAIRSDRTLGGSVEDETEIVGFELASGALGQARVVEVMLRVRCRAILV